MMIFEQRPHLADEIKALEERINNSTSWEEIECLWALIEDLELEG